MRKSELSDRLFKSSAADPPDEQGSLYWRFEPDTYNAGELVFTQPESRQDLWAARTSSEPTDESAPRLSFLSKLKPALRKMWRRHRPFSARTVKELASLVSTWMPQEAMAQIEGPRSVDSRLVIAADSPLAVQVPWECLAYLGQRQNLPSLSVVHDATGAFPRPTAHVEGSFRVLLVVATPRDEKAMNIDAELAVVQPHSSRVVVQQLRWPTLVRLREAMSAFSPHVVHIVGHARRSFDEGYLILHDTADGSCWVDARVLAAALPPSVKLLNLSTCISARNSDVGGLPAFANADAPLPTTIATTCAVTCEGATAFWAACQAALFDESLDVIAAVEAGRRAVREREPDKGDWIAYGLWLRDSPQLFQRVASSTQTQAASHYLVELANELAKASRSLPPASQQRLLADSAELAGQAKALEDAPPDSFVGPNVPPYGAGSLLGVGRNMVWKSGAYGDTSSFEEQKASLEAGQDWDQLARAWLRHADQQKGAARQQTLVEAGQYWLARSEPDKALVPIIAAYRSGASEPAPFGGLFRQMIDQERYADAGRLVSDYGSAFVTRDLLDAVSDSGGAERADAGVRVAEKGRGKQFLLSMLDSVIRSADKSGGHGNSGGEQR